MLEKLKQNLAYVFCIALGLLNFVFLAIPFTAAFVKIGSEYESEGLSGYDVMEEMEAFSELDFGSISSLFVVFALIFAIIILIVGIVGLLKEFGVIKMPDEILGIKCKKWAEYALIAYASVVTLMFLFFIIFTAKNTETEKMYGETYKAGFKLSGGLILNFLFAVGAVVGVKVLEKYMPATDTQKQRVSYACSVCGKKAKASDKFCSACGGVVEQKVVVPEEYVCSGCGKKAKATDRFCNLCGGEIVKTEVTAEVAVAVEEAPQTEDTVL